MAPLLLRTAHTADQIQVAKSDRKAGRGLSATLGLEHALPDLTLTHDLGLAVCNRHAILPWRRIGGEVILLASTTALPADVMHHITTTLGPIRLHLMPRRAVRRTIDTHFGSMLAHMAETSLPAVYSCRTWDRRVAARVAIFIAAIIAVVAAINPTLPLMLLTLWACATLITNTALRLASASINLWPRKQTQPTNTPVLAHLPIVSILVPLYHERAVATQIIPRMAALTYPKDKLDLCLVVEDDDAETRLTIEATLLPDWVQVITVPRGTIRTKPRALNFALPHAKGSIIGVYDAEDTPAPDQIDKVVQRFAERGQDVACLQGILDYENPRSTWISRCFTLEYATWFRLILPGLERLGMIMPLGGTTLFLRRAAIDKVGGWDAHNVTEDADLGLRLVRHGYRTEMIESVTMEEANARAWPWIRQRSRWLKGYAMTWAVHMRQPVRLWRDVGAWRFFGVQVLFLGTLSSFVLAPLLWSFWLVLFGLPHPLDAVVPRETLIVAGRMFLCAELLGIAVTILAMVRAGRPRLGWWAPALQLYFPMATIAAYKGLAEMISRPFFWDKTEHGVHVTATPPPPLFPHQSAAE